MARRRLLSICTWLRRESGARGAWPRSKAGPWIRRWPGEAETAELYRDVSVAADEYLRGAASGLTLGELVSALGRRADALTDVWNDWDRLRPLLLAGAA